MSGIYEPRIDNKGKGCPNYFFQETIAPKYGEGDISQFKITEWRLIWEDKRYLDGAIPEEEKAYIFDLEYIGVNNTQHYAIEKMLKN